MAVSINFGKNRKRAIQNKQMSWATNVLKSIGYSSKSLIENMVPSTMELVSNNAETVTEMLRDMRSMRMNSKRLMSAMKDNDYVRIAGDALANAREDLRSGQLHNAARIERMAESYGDDDLGMDFGEDGFSFDSGDDGASVTIHANITEDNPMVQATRAQTEAIVATAEANQKVQLAVANNQMIADKRMLDMMAGGFATINDNLGQIINFQSENMSKFTAAAISYYSESIGYLKTMAESLTSMGKEAEMEERRKREDPLDAVLGNGFSLSEYAKLVKRQLGSVTDSNMFISPIKSMLSDKETLKLMAANPLSFIPTMIVGKLVPEFMTQSLQKLDNMVKEFIPALLSKMAGLRNSSNPILQFLGEVFGIRSQTKTKVDLGRYAKGPTPFDGQTKYAIVHIIPAYLSKILSALNGKDEIVPDWKTGTLKDRGTVQKEWKKELQNERLAPINDIVSKVEQRLADRIQFSDEKEAKKFSMDVKEFFEKMMMSEEFVNFRKMRDSDGAAINEITKIKDLGPVGNQLLRAALLLLDHSEQARLVGSARIESQARMKKFLEAVEDGSAVNNAFSVFGDQSKGSIVSYDAHGNIVLDGRGRVKLDRNSLIAGSDKYGKMPIDYLRDIRTLLLKGIYVFPRRITGGGTGGSAGVPSHIQSMGESVSQETDTLNVPTPTPYDDEEIRASLATNRVHINTLSDLSQYTDEELQALLAETPQMPTSSNNGGVGGGWKERWGRLKQRFTDIVRSPATLLKGLFDRVDQTLYDLIFTPDGDGQRSFFGKLFDDINAKFDQAMTWLNTKLLQPLREFFFEGPNSLKEKFKNSRFYDWLGKKKDAFVELLLGVKGPDGSRTNGLFSGVWNNLNLIGLQFRHQITGAAYKDPITGEEKPRNENSVFSHFGRIMTDYSQQVKQYLFGDKSSSDPDKKQGILSSAFSGIVQGFQSFGDAIFGHRKDKDGNRVSNVNMEGFFQKMKEHAPKALAVGIVGAGLATINGLSGGLLPSLFLPTGPIGGALLGVSLSFLSQSEKFMTFMFGAKGADDVRLGGLISKKTQDFFKEHKTALIGGATFGLIKGMLGFNGLGIMTGLLGGPIAGAMMGLGASLLTRSEAFKNLMFGEEIDGKRAGGLVGRITSSIKDKDGNNAFGKVAAGAIGGATLGLIASKFGLVGSMMLGGGPLIGALLGVASGLALTNEKWKKALFGEFDEDKQIRKGGVFGKFINWTKLEIFEPIKLKFAEINIGIRQWFEESIANPFKDALAPIRHEFKLMTDNMKEMFATGWKNFTDFLGNTFEKYVGAPFGKVMEEKVLKPLKGFFNRLIKGAGMIIGGVLSAPFKAMSTVAMGLQGKHERQGVQDMRNNAWSALKNQISFKNIAGVFGAYLSMAKQEEAKKKGAPYRDKLREEKAARDQRTKDKFAKEREKHRKRQDEWNRRRGKAKVYDYDNVAYDENGNEIDVSSNYDIRNPEDRVAANASIVTATMEDGTQVPVSVSPDGSATIVEDVGALASVSEPASVPQETEESSARVVTAPTSSSRRGRGRRKASVASPSPRGRRPNKPIARTSIVSSPSISSASIAEDVSTPSSSGSTRGMDRRTKILHDISKDVRNIAAEVNGQLDGVGSNVYKIRKIVQGQAGVSDEDIAGSANRDRKGILGKIRSALYRPIDGLMKMLMTPLQKITDVIVGIKDRMVEFGKFIINIPKNLLMGFGNLLKDVYEGFKLLGKSLLVIPSMIADGVKAVLSVGVEAVKAIGPMIGEALKGVGEIFYGIGASIKHVMVESAKGAAEVFHALGTAAGNVIKGLSSLVPMTFGFIKDTMSFVGHSMIEVSKFAVTGIFELFKGGFALLGFPVKLLAAGAAKLGDKALGLGFSHHVQLKGADQSIPVHLTEPASMSDSTMDKIKHIMGDICDCISNSLSGGSGSRLSGRRAGRWNRMFRGHSVRNLIQNRFQNLLLNDSAANTLTALQAHDEDDDREEAAKAEEARLREEQAERQAEVMDQTAAARIARLDEEERQSAQERYQAEMLENTRRTADATEGHRSTWDSIFGMKGLLFLGALGIFAAIKKFLKDGIKIELPSIEDIINQIRNIFVNKEGRTDEDGNVIPNSNADETLMKGGIKTALKMLGPVSRFGMKVAKKIGKGASKLGAKVANSKLVTKIKGALDGVLKKISEAVTKKFGGGKASKVVQTIQGVFRKIFTPKTIASHADELAEAAAKDGSKAAGSAATIGIVAAIFAAYDGISGAYEARRFFRLPKDYEVTTSMRVVSAIIKILTEFSATASLGITLAEEFMGMEIRRELSMNLLKIFDKEGAAKAAAGHAEFESDLAAYNEAHGTKLTETAWNDRENKTMFQDMTSDPLGFLGKGVGGIWDATKGFAKWTGGKVKAGLGWAGNKIKGGLNWVGNKVKGGLNWVGNRLKSDWASYEDSIRQQLGLAGDAKLGLGQHISSLAGNILGYSTFGFIDREKAAQHIEAIRSSFTRGLEDFSASVSKWAEGIPEWFDGVKKSIDEGIGLAMGWKDENGNPMTASETFKKTVKVVRDHFTAIGKFASDAYKAISNLIKSSVEFLENAVKNAMRDAGNWISEKLNLNGPATEEGKARLNDTLQYFDYQTSGFNQRAGEEARSRQAKRREEAKKRGADNLNSIYDRYRMGTSGDGASMDVTDWEKTAIIQTDLEKKLHGVKDNAARERIITTFRATYREKGYSDSVITDAINKAEERYGRMSGSGGGSAYFSQNDPRWKNKSVAGGTMGDLGCGPTAMAMVGSALGRRVNPSMMQDLANKGGFASNRGVSANYIGASANAMGLQSHQILGPGAQAISDSVQRGPVVLLGRNPDSSSPYTSRGHYVVAKKTGSRGKVQIMDPRGAGRNKVVPISALGGTMAAWEFGAGETAGEKVAEKMKSLEGKLTYTQYPGAKIGDPKGNRAHIEKGYGDCSSTVQWCYKTTVGIDPGATTAAQLQRGVEVIKGGPGAEIDSAVISRLKPGDLVIYGRGNKTTHVEMYVGNGQMMGHGDVKVKGPKYHDIKKFHKIIKKDWLSIRRYVDDEGNALNPGDKIAGGVYNASGSNSSISDSGEGLSTFGALAKMGEVFATAFGKAIGLLGDEAPVSDDGDVIVGSSLADIPPARITDPSAQSTMGTDPTNKTAVRTRKLTEWKPITAAQINEFIEGKVRKNPKNASSLFRGHGQAFVDAAKKTGLDPRYILAHAAWESAWGTSPIARDKGNFFGIQAYNDSPYASAKSFKRADGTIDVPKSVLEGAQWINQNYTSIGDDSLYKMIYEHKKGAYAVTNDGKPSDSWIDGIASVMAEMGALSGSGEGIPIKGQSLTPRGFNRARQPITSLYSMHGSGEADATLIKEMIEVLRSIDKNTGGSKLAAEALLTKYRAPETTILRSGDVNVDARRTGRSGRETSIENDTRRQETYMEAKRIAKGKLA